MHNSCVYIYIYTRYARPLALVSTPTLTEMSVTNVSWGVKKADAYN